MNRYTKLLNNLEELKLNKLKDYLPNYIDTINKQQLTFVDGLLKLTDKEIEFRNERASKIQIAVSAFPGEKTLEEFDFSFQPSINKEIIKDFSNLRFIEKNENIIFFGSSGVGKTHLAIAIGIYAAKNRNITYFISCHDLITKLIKAKAENKLSAKLKHYAKYKLLIIDEIGYLPIDREGGNLLFQLIAKRYEKKSTIITTNQSFSKWAEIFSSAIIANAILDRLVHYSHIIRITGPSYRLKGKFEEQEFNSKNHLS